MCARSFICNFVRLTLSLLVVCLITMECAYCVCDKEDWCKDVPANATHCTCIEQQGVNCDLKNYNRCTVTGLNEIGTIYTYTAGTTQAYFPNYTISIQELKKIQKIVDDKLSNIESLKNNEILDILTKIQEVKKLTLNIDKGIKQRKSAIEFVATKNQKRTNFINYDDINEDIRSDILSQADRKQAYHTSVSRVINKISEQRTASTNLDNTKLDAAIKEFFSETVKELAQDINDIGVIKNEISNAYKSNNYDDIIEFSEDLRTKIDSVRKTKESLNNVYKESKSYIEKHGVNVDNIVEDTALGACTTTNDSSKCKKEITKLLQDPQEYFASLDNKYREIINEISEQGIVNKVNIKTLDETIKDSFTIVVKELARDMNDICVINGKISNAYSDNNYDDIIRFSEELKNKLDSVRKTKAVLNYRYKGSKSYLKSYTSNVDNIVQSAASEFYKNSNSKCKEGTTKLLQNPQEYFDSLDKMYKDIDPNIKSVKVQKELKLKQEKRDLEQKKQQEQEEKKQQDNIKIKDLRSKIANNIAIVRKWEKYITDDQVTKIINKGILSDQDIKLLQNIVRDLEDYKSKIAEIFKDINELQKLDSTFNKQDLFPKKSEMEKLLVQINKTLQSLTEGSTANNAQQDDEFEDSQPSISTNCNFVAYDSISQEAKDNTLISFIYNNINFGCSNTCNSPNKSFEICLKIKHPDHCGNCVKITVDDSEFKSIKELFNIQASNKNDAPVLVRENAVNTIQLKSMNNKGLLCLYARTAYGNMPLICKNISSDIPQVENQTNSVCNLRDHSKSRVPFNFSGRAMECIKSTLDGALYGTKMDTEQLALVLRPLSYFQRSMKIVVSIALLLYIILFAAKAMLIENFVTREKLVTGVLKIIVVAYLSVGLNPTNKIGKVANGIQDYLLPLFSSITYDLSHLLLTAANTTKYDKVSSQSAPLCYFNPDKDYQNSVVGRNYALWDAIDCRLSYYLGYRLAYNYTTTSTLPDKSALVRIEGYTNSEIKENMKTHLSNSLFKGSELDKDDTFLVIPVIWKMLLGGEFIIAVVMLAFCFVFVTLIWRLIGIFITNLVNLYVMFYLSPITVPMLLFDQTKSIFNRWLTMTFSFALQPGIAVSFIAVFMILMDSAVYKTCEFVRYDYENSNQQKQIISTFELKMPPADIPNIDIYTSPSEVGENAQSICMKSPGYRLMEFYNGKNLYERKFLFFNALAMNAEIEFLHSMVAILVFCIIFYYFFSQVDSFAAMLTNGISKIELSIPSLPSIPGIGNRNRQQGAKDKYSSNGKTGAQDKFIKGKEGAQDKFIKGREGAHDKFVTTRSGIGSSSNDSTTTADTVDSSTSSRVNNIVKIKIGDKEIVYDRNKVADVQGTIGIKIDNQEFNFNISEIINVSEMISNGGMDKVLRLQIGEKESTYNLTELMKNPVKEDVVAGKIDIGSREHINGTINIKIGDQEFNYGLNELISNQTQTGVNDSYNRSANSSDGNNSISDTDTTSESPSTGEKENNSNSNK